MADGSHAQYDTLEDEEEKQSRPIMDTFRMAANLEQRTFKMPNNMHYVESEIDVQGFKLTITRFLFRVSY